MSTSTTTLPAGTWELDAAHSSVSFSVRHLMVSKVRGQFTDFTADIVTAEDPLASKVSAVVQMASIDTRDSGRDEHLRTNDFFDAENHPTIDYKATGVKVKGDNYVVLGELTIRGTTKPIELFLELNGVGVDAYGKTRAGLTLTGSFNRKDFGVSWNNTLDNGGVAVGDKVGVELDLAVILREQ